MFMKSGKCIFPSLVPSIFTVFYLLECLIYRKVSHCMANNQICSSYSLVLNNTGMMTRDSNITLQTNCTGAFGCLEEMDDILKDIPNLPLQTWNREFRKRHVTIIKILSQLLQFHGHESCIKFKVTACTRWHQCHFFPHFIIINRISRGSTDWAREASWSQDGCNLTLMYSKNGSPRSPSLCSAEREVVCERV